MPIFNDWGIYIEYVGRHQKIILYCLQNKSIL